MKHAFLLHRISLNFNPHCRDTTAQRCDPETYADMQQNLSAAFLTPDQQLWLGSDEACTLECLTLSDRFAFGNHQHLHLSQFLDLPAGEDHEIDIEGLDYSDRYLWLVGSHSYKRKKPKASKSDSDNLQRMQKLEFEANRYLLARIPLVDQKLHAACTDPEDRTRQLTASRLAFSDRGNILLAALAEDEHLGPFIQAKIPGKENGFDIEGIVVRKNRVFLGLRGPVLRGWAVILELELKSVNATTLELKAIGKQGQPYRKHLVNLGGLGIRDLSLQDQDLFILAGPTMDLDGPVQLFRLKQALEVLDRSSMTEPNYLFDLPFGFRDDHAEGFSFCSSLVGQPAILVVYDTPAKIRSGDAHTVLADIFALDL